MTSTSTKQTTISLFILLVSFFFTITSNAQNGSLDATFGTGGKVVTSFGGKKDFATCMLLQPDNKIVVAGHTRLGGNPYFALARYNENGSLDKSFGNNGKLTTMFAGVKEVYLESIKLQDDKIVGGGYFINGDMSDFVLVRYKADGTLDSTFGTNGLVITPLDGSSNKATSIAIETNGNILIAGHIDCKPAVRRYDANGSTSLFFAQNGIGALNGGGIECQNVNSMFLFATAGQLILSGETTGSIDNMFLVALRTDGTGKIDSSFGENGVVKTHIKDTSGIFASLAQPDGKIVVAGYDAATGGFEEFLIARYKKNGTLDSSFGTNGVTEVPFSANARVSSMALEPNGSIIVTGNVYAGLADAVVWVSLSKDGVVDSSYGLNGEVIDFNGMGDDAVATVVQPDGKVVIAGYTLTNEERGYDFIVARYNTAESLPVKLSSFTAAAVKNMVSLNWSTSTEISNSYFTIERSSGNNNFTAIGKVNTKGNTNQVQEYNYLDAQPLNGDNYYRLNQVDRDGRYSYSKTVHVLLGATPYLKAYPNPAKSVVKIEGLGIGGTITLADISGKAINRVEAKANAYSFNVQNLAPGTYFIRVQQGSKITTLKLVKE